MTSTIPERRPLDAASAAAWIEATCRAHVERDVRVIAMERHRVARIAEKAAYRANLTGLSPAAPTPIHPR